MKACTREKEGIRRWGRDHYRQLQRRLTSLVAAETLEEMSGVPGNCHQLRADRAEEFAVSLLGAYRLVFEVDHDPIPRRADGGIDRTRVTKICITEVVDYHGD